MSKNPIQVFEIIKFLGTMPAGNRPFGLIFEEPTGRYLPETLSGWTKAVRLLMDKCNWRSGHLLAHIHEKWSFAEVTQLVAGQMVCGLVFVKKGPAWAMPVPQSPS